MIEDDSAAAAEASQTGSTRWVWPASNQFNKLGGSEGTELIFACAAKQQVPAKADLLSFFGKDPLPQLGVLSWLEIDDQGVTAHRSRGPSEENIEVADDMIERADRLRRLLSGKIDAVEGIAFPHRNP